MADSRTIIACATGEAFAARALVRLSGAACAEVDRVLLARPSGARSRLTARLRLSGRLELPCLAWRGIGPRSYTGEDTLELLMPGNPHLVQRVVARICAAVPEVRPAEPGEFSARAYANGKLTLEQAEGVAAVIAATGADQLASAESVLNGAAGVLYRSWAEEVAGLLALVEAGIDFSDQEDVVAIEPRVLHERTQRLRAAIGAQLGGARESRTGLARVVLIGRPNAGKSTLFNALLGRSRAVASPVAGTTRDVLVEPLTVSLPGREPVDIELVDLPGLDANAVGSDRSGQEAAHLAVQSASVQLRCCESGRFEGFGEPQARTRTVLVRTKADRPGWVEGAEAAVCALTGAGLDRLLHLIAAAASGRGDRGGAVVARHARAMQAADEALSRIDGSAPAELNAHHLRAALDSLGEIGGAVPPDEVIGRIFASFCVGK